MSRTLPSVGSGPSRFPLLLLAPPNTAHEQLQIPTKVSYFTFVIKKIQIIFIRKFKSEYSLINSYFRAI